MAVSASTVRASHPKDASHKLIDTIAAQPKLCKHLHLPVQCGSDRLLQQMNRHYTIEQYLELIEYARKTVPGIFAALVGNSLVIILITFSVQCSSISQ